jgi:hypothetical protein
MYRNPNVTTIVTRWRPLSTGSPSLGCLVTCRTSEGWRPGQEWRTIKVRPSNGRPHCKDTIPKIWNKYSQKLNCAASHSLFHVSDRFIYSHDRSAYLLQQNKWTLSWGYINRPQIHECGNWKRGRAVSFLGIHKTDLVCSAADVNHLSLLQKLTYL